MVRIRIGFLFICLYRYMMWRFMLSEHTIRFTLAMSTNGSALALCIAAASTFPFWQLIATNAMTTMKQIIWLTFCIVVWFCSTSGKTLVNEYGQLINGMILQQRLVFIYTLIDQREREREKFIFILVVAWIDVFSRIKEKNRSICLSKLIRMFVSHKHTCICAL